MSANVSPGKKEPCATADVQHHSERGPGELIGRVNCNGIEKVVKFRILEIKVSSLFFRIYTHASLKYSFIILFKDFNFLNKNLNINFFYLKKS